MTLDEAYEQYKATGDNNVLGEPLLLMLKKTINKSYGSKLDLEDATGDVCVEVFKDLPTFDGNSKFSTWVTKIAHTTCLDIIKKKEPEWEPLTGKEVAPDMVGAINAKAEVRSLLATLPTRQKRLMELKLLGYTSKEIAAMLGYSSYDSVDHTYEDILEKLKTLGGGSESNSA